MSRAEDLFKRVVDGIVKARVLLWFGVGLVILGTGSWIWHVAGDWGTWALTVAVFIVAAWTLDAMILQPPRIWVSKPDELGYTDLIFYLYDHQQRRVPRDYLLQLHALLGNTGGKKAIITSVKVAALRGPAGEEIQLPDLPKTIGGQHYSTWTSWRDIHSSFDRLEVPPPFILAPNEVLVLRFRGRRGIDWGPRWTLGKLKEFHNALVTCPTHASIEVTYRWGRQRRTFKEDVPLKIEQHREYVDQLRYLTHDFTASPSIPEQRVAIE